MAVTRVASVVLAVMLVSACGVLGGEAEEPDLDQVVAAAEEIPSVKSVVRLDEDNDPDELLGRPGGYTAGAVFHDESLDCPQPGIDCGAVLEVWDDPEDARVRAEQITALQTGMQWLGAERHFRNGGLLLRVNADLPDATVEEYGAVIAGD